MSCISDVGHALACPAVSQWRAFGFLLCGLTTSGRQRTSSSVAEPQRYLPGATWRRASGKITAAWKRGGRSCHAFPWSGPRGLFAKLPRLRSIAHPDPPGPWSKRPCSADSVRCTNPVPLWYGREGYSPSCGFVRGIQDSAQLLLRKDDGLLQGRFAPRRPCFPNLLPCFHCTLCHRRREARPTAPPRPPRRIPAGRVVNRSGGLRYLAARTAPFGRGSVTRTPIQETVTEPQPKGAGGRN